jgi:pimeloyl-ACP methyl ester carboxylesterase
VARRGRGAIVVTDGLLHHEQRGEGPPVVFLHAGIVDSRMWEPQWTAWHGFRLVRCDLPGFGASPPRAGPTCAAAEVATLLDALALGPARLVGCSFGARLALELAVARPDLVAALVLVGASMPGAPPTDDVRAFSAAEEALLAAGDLDAAVELNVATWFDGPRRGPDSAHAAPRAAVTEMCAHAFAQQLPLLAELEYRELVLDLPDRLADVAVPALVVVGDEDVDWMLDSAPLLAETLPRAGLAALTGAAHFPSLERPAEFDDVVLPFLTGV